MKRTVILLLILITTLSTFASPDDAREIQSCYASFKKHVMENNGPAIINLIDKQSENYCNELVDDSLYLTTERFNKLPIIKKYLIMRLSTCSSISFETHLKMHGREFIAYSVSNGWFNDELAASVTIGDVSINGNIAFADIYRYGKKTGHRYKFFKEGDKWKFSFLSYLTFINSSMKNDCLKSGKNEDAYLKSILQPLVNESLENYIFEPVLSK